VNEIKASAYPHQPLRGFLSLRERSEVRALFFVSFVVIK
jgi:hypothetical protein